MGMIINPYRFASTYPSVLNDGNTVAWYIASEASTVTKDGSNLVSSWNDYLGSGHDLIQTTDDTYKPIWSSDGISFDGSNDYMKTADFTYGQPQFIYLVLKMLSWTSDDYIIDGSQNSRMCILQYTNTNYISFRANAIVGEVLVGTSNFVIIRALFNGTSSKLQINNNTALTGNPGPGAGGGITLCRYATSSDRFANIQFKELIFRKIADSSADETAIYNYLATKYSIT